MAIPEDPRERKKWMMQVLQDYGREFLIFEPEDQPNVFAAPEPEYRDLKSGNLDPRELKSWRYLDFTLKFVQESYGLFGEGSLGTDCPIHKLHPLKGERPDDFRNAFQLTAEGTIKFRCRRSIGCQRSHCSAKTNRAMDLYDLVSWLEGKGLEYARRTVSDYYEREYGWKLGYFPKGEGGTEDKEQSSVMRFAVPKTELERILSIPLKGRGASARFVTIALQIICSAPEEPYDGHKADTGKAILLSRSFDWKARLPEMGNAARLFLWVHWRQAEAGARLSLTDQEIAEALNVDRRTIQTWKQFLVGSGYLEVSEAEGRRSIWSANLHNRDRKNLMAMWTWGQNILDLESNPAAKIKPLPYDMGPQYTPPTEDILRVLAAAKREERIFLNCYLHTAARRSEIFRWTWVDDINFEKREVRLGTRKTKDGSMEYEWLPMSDELHAELWSWWESRPIKVSPYVFVSTSNRHYGKPFTTRRRFMKGLCKRAGVKEFGFHALRRYVASVLADTHKVSAKTIQRILRHKHLATTERYIHNINRDLTGTMNLLAEKGPQGGPHKIVKG